MDKIDLELIVAAASENPDGTSDKNLLRLKISSKDGKVHVESPGVSPDFVESGPARVSAEQLPAAEYKALPPHEPETALAPLVFNTFSNREQGLVPYSSEKKTSERPRDSKGRFVSTKKQSSSYGMPSYHESQTPRDVHYHNNYYTEHYHDECPDSNQVYQNPERTGLEHLHEVDRLAMQLEGLEELKKKDPSYEKGNTPKTALYVTIGAVAIAALVVGAQAMQYMQERQEPVQRVAQRQQPASSPTPQPQHKHYNCSGETYRQVSRKLTGRPGYAEQIREYNVQHNPYFDNSSRRCKGTIYLPPDLPEKQQKRRGWRTYHINGSKSR